MKWRNWKLTLDARLIGSRAVIFPHWSDRWRWNMVAVSRTMIHPLNSVLAMMATNWKHHLEIQHLNYFGYVVLAQQDYFLFQRMEFLLPSQFAEECSHHLNASPITNKQKTTNFNISAPPFTPIFYTTIYLLSRLKATHRPHHLRSLLLQT